MGPLWRRRAIHINNRGGVRNGTMPIHVVGDAIGLIALRIGFGNDTRVLFDSWWFGLTSGQVVAMAFDLRRIDSMEEVIPYHNECNHHRAPQY